MSENKELFEWFDSEISSCKPAIKYAEENLELIITSAYQNSTRKVHTTHGYELGIACPSLINHRVIGGHKKGRIIKKIPKDATYCEIGYDAEDKPLYFKEINEFGTESTNFFFDYQGYIWVMDMELYAKGELYRCVSEHGIKKYRYDEQGRIQFYAEVYPYGSLDANVYQYPDDPEQPIICHYYRYGQVDPMDIFGRSEPRFYEALYEITPDLKIITEYLRRDGEFVFSRQISSGGKKSSKPKAVPDAFEKFSEWLDSELEKDIPDGGGIYFDLFSPTEDGFGVYFCVTKDFDADDEDDDWACGIIYSSDNMCMINTNGLMELENARKVSVKFIKKYIVSGKHMDIIKKYDGVGTGFSEGGIEYISINEK